MSSWPKYERSIACSFKRPDDETRNRPSPLWYDVIFSWFSGLRLGDSLRLDLVKEVNDDVVFLDAKPVKVLPHRAGQLILALSSELLAPADGRGVQADASGLGKNPLVYIAGECGRCVETVGSSVSVEDVPFESGPLELVARRTRLANVKLSERSNAHRRRSEIMTCSRQQ